SRKPKAAPPARANKTMTMTDSISKGLSSSKCRFRLFSKYCAIFGYDDIHENIVTFPGEMGQQLHFVTETDQSPAEGSVAEDPIIKTLTKPQTPTIQVESNPRHDQQIELGDGNATTLNRFQDAESPLVATVKGRYHDKFQRCVPHSGIGAPL